MSRKKRKKKAGIHRQLGVRYGSTLRKRYFQVMSERKKAHKCPKCGFASIRRESVGIWNCQKCGLTFTGGAYTPETKLGIVSKRLATRLAASKT